MCRIAGGEGPFPAGAAADVVEVGRAVGVGGGPFTADCRPPPVVYVISIASSIERRISIFGKEGGGGGGRRGDVPSVGGVNLLNHMIPIIADEFNAVSVFEDDLARVEDGVLMCVKQHVIGDIIALEHFLPFTQIQEAVVEGYPGRDVVSLD